MNGPHYLLFPLILATVLYQGGIIARDHEIAISKDETTQSNSRTITLTEGTRQEFELLHIPTNVRRIYLRNCDIDDVSLKRLEGLTQLLYLSLEGSNISGDGLTVFRTLPSLKSLSLNGTRLTYESLQHLIGAKNLSTLLLNDTDVSDEGATSLVLLRRLEWLYLNRTRVSDVSMRKFGKLEKLKFLSLLGTAVTDTGVADLQSQIPSVRVRR